MRTNIPEAEARRIRKALRKRWGHRLQDEHFEVSGWIEQRAVQVTLLLRRLDDSLHYPMEVRVNLADNNIEPLEGKDLALDFLDWYIGQYLDSGRELMLPLAWSAHEFGEHTIEARGQVRNVKLERAADDLLEGRITVDEIDPATGDRTKGGR